MVCSGLNALRAIYIPFVRFRSDIDSGLVFGGQVIARKVLTQLSAELDQDSNVVGNTDLIWQNDFGT